MLTVIPAIDIIDNKVVRLRQGNYQSVQFYEESVLQMAFYYQELGFKTLHLVNLSGAKDLKTRLDKLIEQLHIQSKLTLQVGGGIRTLSDIERYINLGIQRIVIGTLLIENQKIIEKVATNYPQITLIGALDILENTVRSNAWQHNTELKLDQLIPALQEIGICDYLITDISRDGMMKGINLDFYQKIRRKFPDISIIASGGITCTDDLEVLDSIGIEACVIGKALIEKKLRVPKQYLGPIYAN